MAGPSIVVRILGDAKGLGTAFDQVGPKANAASGAIKGAFTSVLGTLNNSGVLGPFGESIARVTESLDGITAHGKDVGKAMLGVGGTLAGVGVGLQAIGSKDKAAHQQLQQSVEATGASYDDYEKAVEKAVKSQEKYGSTANQTQDALRLLTQATHDPAKALDLLGTASNVAAAKHEDLSTAAGQVGKVFNGNKKLLKEYGIVIDATTGKTKDGKDATQALADITAGQASAAADTFTGKLDAVKARVEDAAAAFGQKYGPAITAAGAVMTGLGATIEVTRGILGLFRTSQEGVAIAETATAAAAGVEGAAMDAEAASATAADAASLPIIATVGLIVLAVAALIAIAYELYTHWDTIWKAIKAAAEAVFNWIKTNWPLLLAILTGPIGLAVLAISRHWEAIKTGAKAAVDWVMGVFTALPTQVARIFNGVGSAISNAFKVAFNAVAIFWNETIGSLSFHIPSWVPGLGGKGFDVPDIPHLAQGGLITQTGLIFAHAGEAITPAGQAPGPAMYIENAQFNEPVDVDVLSKRLEFALSAGLPV